MWSVRGSGLVLSASAVACVVACSFTTACASSPPPPPPEPPPAAAEPPAPVATATAEPASSPAVGSPPMPADSAVHVPLGSDANGLFWNAATDTLLLADDDRHVRAWKEDDAHPGGVVSDYAELPATTLAHVGLGQLVQLADGTIVVTRFGGGTEGGVVVVHPDHTSTVVPKLDKTRRRIGLTATADGKLFDSYFVKGGSGAEGAIARLDLHGKETDVVPSLKKPVGVLATATELVITDQDARQVVTFPLPIPPAKSHTEPKVLAPLPSADLLAAGPEGSFLTGGRDGVVRQIDASGEVHEIVSGFHEVRGIAFDPKKHRLFFVDHEGGQGNSGGSSTLIIRSL